MKKKKKEVDAQKDREMYPWFTREPRKSGRKERNCVINLTHFRYFRAVIQKEKHPTRWKKLITRTINLPSCSIIPHVGFVLSHQSHTALRATRSLHASRASRKKHRKPVFHSLALYDN